MTHELRFDPDQHLYTLWGDGYDGLPIPSITQVIQKCDMYGYPRNASNIAKMNHGSRVHKYSELFDQQMIDVEDVMDEAPEILAYQKFVKEMRFKPNLIEERFFHQTYFYAGTIDRHGTLDIGGKKTRAVIEIKTGVYHPAVNLQLAAQVELLEPRGHRVEKALALYLRPDGEYAIKEATDHAMNWKTFLAALCVIRWKELNKIGR